MLVLPIVPILVITISAPYTATKLNLVRKSPAKTVDMIIQNGNSHDCRTQSMILFNFVIGINYRNHTHLQLGVSHLAIERVNGAARARVGREVMWRQSSMTLTDNNEWVDAEADEEWGCKERSRGPGPLRSSEWIKVAQHLVDTKRIILHTDGDVVPTCRRHRDHRRAMEIHQIEHQVASSMSPTRRLTSMIASGLPHGAIGRKASVLGSHFGTTGLNTVWGLMLGV
eukprot:6485604-Amphidinium_carterae.2